MNFVSIILIILILFIMVISAITILVQDAEDATKLSVNLLQLQYTRNADFRTLCLNNIAVCMAVLDGAFCELRTYSSSSVCRTLMTTSRSSTTTPAPWVVLVGRTLQLRSADLNELYKTKLASKRRIRGIEHPISGGLYVTYIKHSVVIPPFHALDRHFLTVSHRP